MITKVITEGLAQLTLGVEQTRCLLQGIIIKVKELVVRLSAEKQGNPSKSAITLSPQSPEAPKKQAVKFTQTILEDFYDGEEEELLPPEPQDFIY